LLSQSQQILFNSFFKFSKITFFYDCPGFAVLTSDFGAGLNARFVQKATQDTKNVKVAAATTAIKKKKDV
jgi:hypothetical protein